MLADTTQAWNGQKRWSVWFSANGRTSGTADVPFWSTCPSSRLPSCILPTGSRLPSCILPASRLSPSLRNFQTDIFILCVKVLLLLGVSCYIVVQLFPQLCGCFASISTLVYALKPLVDIIWCVDEPKSGKPWCVYICGCIPLIFAFFVLWFPCNCFTSQFK